MPSPEDVAAAHALVALSNAPPPVPPDAVAPAPAAAPKPKATKPARAIFRASRV